MSLSDVQKATEVELLPVGTIPVTVSGLGTGMPGPVYVTPESDRLLMAEALRLRTSPEPKRLAQWSDGTLGFVKFSDKRSDAESYIRGYTRAQERKAFLINTANLPMTGPMAARVPGWDD